MMKADRVHPWIRRVAIEVAGWTLVVLGIAALVLPGPGLLMLAAGLAVLSLRYVWADRLLHPIKARALEAAALGVQTWPRILLSMLGVLLVMTVGVVWGLQPPVPGWWPLEDRWWLPGGWVTGGTMIGSGIIAISLIVYSYRRFRPSRLAR
ncbi:PGPGW domain-containing protein [Arthrobacter sp. H20]|uniref:PGPGW domain-containing protein n=1 Tax=Arthrobacter sp. H20 TaxID=1267981 RepID=UPI000479CE96|nr:PGPGW domain-containing protein [Arthrobacter sp. H20]